MENGQELTRAGCHPKPRRHFGFCREGAVPPSSRLWDEDVPGDAACAGCSLHQCSHMEMCQCRVAPLDVPLSSIPCATLKASPCSSVPVCRPCGWRDKRGSRSGMHPGLFPPSMDFGELCSCCRVCGRWTVGLRVAHLWHCPHHQPCLLLLVPSHPGPHPLQCS